MEKFISPDKVITIRNIIDIDDILKRSKEPISEKFDTQKTIIVSVGRLAKPKAFDLSIETAKVLREKDVDFSWYIIGEGAERDYLQGLINKNDLQNHIVLLGFRENPYPYIKQTDIYVQTSFFEGLGRTLIEASILCKPIVSTNFPSAFGILQHKETGLITEMDPASIAKAIKSLIDDNDLREYIIQNLKNQVDNGKEDTLNKLENLFQGKTA